MPSSLRQEEFLTRADHVLRGCVAVRVLEGVEARRAVGKNIADSVSIQGSLCYRRSATHTPAGGLFVPVLPMPAAPAVPVASLPVPEFVFTPLPCIKPTDIDPGVGVRSGIPLVPPVFPPVVDPAAPPGLEGVPPLADDPVPKV